MKIIAFDLGAATGVAIGDTGDRPYCHTERLGKAGGTHGPRFTQALQMTLRLIKQHTPDLVVIEKPIAAGVLGGEERVQLAMGYRACVMAACFLKNIRFDEYAVSSIRKHFIGDGKVKRKQAKARTMQRCGHLGWAVTDDNQADAIAAWDYARGQNSKLSTPVPNGLFGSCGNA